MDSMERPVTTSDWQELVLKSATRAGLDEIVSWVRERDRPERRGYRVLFQGAPGTGKTLAAQVLAKQLGLELYRVDLASVVSKYVGETEKNLARVFDEAQARDWILFFDEADALFGKRTEVRDAHDRYANIEVSYLLQRIESYEGLVILVSNLRGNIDPAFLRRLNRIIDFPK